MTPACISMPWIVTGLSLSSWVGEPLGSFDSWRTVVQMRLAPSGLLRELHVGWLGDLAVGPDGLSGPGRGGLSFGGGSGGE